MSQSHAKMTFIITVDNLENQIFVLKKTRNSAVADKLRDAFVQMQ